MSRSSPLSVLVLSKRQYMSRDLLDDRYGRFRELPLALSALGARVRGLCLSYRPRPEGVVHDEAGAGHVEWRSLDKRRLLPLGGASYWRALDEIGAASPVDVVWACSDALHCRLGVVAAKRLGARLVLDLYDNFESYPLARIPGMNRMLRRSVLAADGVSCISLPLERKLRRDYGYPDIVSVIENAIPADTFTPGDRAASRARFGLPHDAQLVGTAGALSRSRGIETLFEALERLSESLPALQLVLAGPRDPDLRIPSGARITDLGLLPAAEVSRLLPALDVSVVGNVDSEFGRYCFPQKLYESLACEVPVAVSRVGAMAELLESQPRFLFEPEDADSLAATISGLLASPALPRLEVPTWPALGRRLLGLLERVAGGPR